jgi:acetylornithine deacetylase/succinyl-diaminopimelate desuccinylase-like protein
MTTPHEYALQHAKQFEAELFELLAIPTISTLSEHANDIERAAQWLVSHMNRIGLHPEIHRRTGSQPLIYAEWLGAGENAPTALIYCHYDVQPATIEDGWHTDPFVPTVQDGKVYARGAVDSKSHVVGQLSAVEALIATHQCPVNIKLLFEGEEETDSSHIFEFVRNNPDKLRADVCILSDGSMPDQYQPALVYGLRGITTMELIITSPQRDLHSGHYGGTVHNPIQALTEILAQLHTPDGKVTVPHFYDKVRPISPEERALWSPVADWIEREWQAVANAPMQWGEPEFALHERIGARPTLEINGIAGGFWGEGFKTVLPMKAWAKISCRLVPDQDPSQIARSVRDYILSLVPPTVKAEIRFVEDGAPGAVIDPTTPPIQALITAYERGWGVKPLLNREGGSIPVIAAFQSVLNSPIVLMPFGYKGCGAHSTNEYMILDMFHKGIATAIHFHQLFAEMARA